MVRLPFVALFALVSACAAAQEEPHEVTAATPTLRIGGFSDLTYSSTGKGVPRNFTLGQFTLHANSQLSPRTFFFAEMTLTPRTDAGTGSPPATGFNAEMERIILRLDQSDQWKFSFGRYHTPINWWNNAFHHGLWLQTTITRPEMTRFGGAFIPVHFVGMLVEGLTHAQELGFGYNLGLGNGRGVNITRGDDAGNSNSDLAWLVNLFIRPDRLYPLQVGGSYYRDTIVLPQQNAPSRRFRENILAFHVVYQRESPELIAEWARAEHKEIGGSASNSEGYYIQAAYRLPGKLAKPYYRYDFVRFNSPAYGSAVGLKGHTVGIRYDISEFVALKGEYRSQKRSASPDISGLFGQISYAF